MDWKERIIADPNICQGKACIKGTRIPVSVVLDNLAVGIGVNELLKSYPTITEEDILASIKYAADIVSERILSIA